MKAWEHLEGYMQMYYVPGQSFTAGDYANALSMTPQRASANIQAYLTEQRKSESRTLYVLKRRPGTRTSAARWDIGHRSQDRRLLNKGFYDDLECRLTRALVPDLLRMADLDPKQAPAVERTVKAVVGGGMVVLAQSLGVEPEDIA